MMNWSNSNNAEQRRDNNESALLDLFHLLEAKEQQEEEQQRQQGLGGTNHSLVRLLPEEETQILNLCRRDNTLLREYLSHDKGLFLINILIGYRVSLKTLQEIFESFPLPFKLWEDGYPLHQACGTVGTQPGVVKFLLEQSQSYSSVITATTTTSSSNSSTSSTPATQKGYCGRIGNLRQQRIKRYPLEWLLMRPDALLEDVKALLSLQDVRSFYLFSRRQEILFRQAIKGEGGNSSATTFRGGPGGGGRMDIMEYLMELFPNFESFGIVFDPFLTRYAKAMAVLLKKQLKILQLHVRNEMEWKAWQILMDAIGHEDSKLYSLHLDLWNLNNSTTTAETTATNNHSSTTTEANNNDTAATTTATATTGSNSNGNFIDDDNFNVLIPTALANAIVSAPKLTELNLIASTKILWADDCMNGGILTKGIATLLQQNQIQRIYVGMAIRLNHPPIFEALKYNTSLLHFGLESCVDSKIKCESLLQVLEENNTHLQQVSLSANNANVNNDNNIPPHIRKKIFYLTQLNQVGRSKVRYLLDIMEDDNKNTATTTTSAKQKGQVGGSSMEVLVDLLLQANQLITLIRPFGMGLRPMSPEQYLYGMLRENPGSWCCQQQQQQQQQDQQ